MTETHNRANWLLRGLIVFSLVLHGLLFSYLTDIFRPRSLHFIELDLKAAEERPKRHIPRPRMRPRTLPAPRIPERIRTAAPPPPAALPRPAPAASPQVTVPPPPSAPKLTAPAVKGVDVAKWKPAPTPAPPPPNPTASSSAPVSAPSGPSDVSESQDLVTIEVYKAQVRQKVVAGTVYPPRARKAGIEGQAVVALNIKADGGLQRVEIAQSAGSRILDAAALKAVKKAAPFPRPPGGSLNVTIPIAFKLI